MKRSLYRPLGHGVGLGLCHSCSTTRFISLCLEQNCTILARVAPCAEFELQYNAPNRRELTRESPDLLFWFRLKADGGGGVHRVRQWFREMLEKNEGRGGCYQVCRGNT